MGRDDIRNAKKPYATTNIYNPGANPPVIPLYTNPLEIGKLLQLQQWPNCPRVGGACHQPHILCKPDMAIVLHEIQFQPPAQAQVAGQAPPSGPGGAAQAPAGPPTGGSPPAGGGPPAGGPSTSGQGTAQQGNNDDDDNDDDDDEEQEEDDDPYDPDDEYQQKDEDDDGNDEPDEEAEKNQLIILKMIVMNMMKYMMTIMMMMMNVILGSMIMIMMIRMMRQIHVKRGNVNRWLKKLRNVKPVNPQHRYENTKKVLRQ